MIRTLFALFTLLAFTSCAKTYNIQGSSSVPTLDGRMLFLKAYDGSGFKNIDSCDIVHGEFNFNGALDSTKIAVLFMDDEGIMPIVLESGEIMINIGDAKQTVSGTPLNEKLFSFIEKYKQLESEYSELGHLQSQAIMDGKDLNAVNLHLAEKAGKISEREDKLVTSFIVENFDNVLGPGVPYVSEYYRKAQQNQAIMNGTAMPGDVTAPVNDVPTPNELASPGLAGADSVASTAAE